MLAFINHFIINTVDFLNTFIANCETKFIAFETKLQHVESSLLIIESKLASVPDTFVDLNDRKASQQEPVKVETKPEATEVASNKEEVTIPDNNNRQQEKEKASEIWKEVDKLDVDNNTEAISEEVKGVKVSEDARYKKYFKMLQFGVPAPAVKLKMKAEGVDGSLLE